MSRDATNPALLPVEAIGEDSFLLRIEDSPGPASTARLTRLAEAIATQFGPTLIEAIPSYSSLFLTFDILRLDFTEIETTLAQFLQSPNPGESAAIPDPGRLHILPVCYHPSLAPDLTFVAESAKVAPEEIAAIHSSVDYQVFAVGFAPGFAYLGTVDPRLEVPRLPTPRREVPAGSVALAGAQTGIYPRPSPGGWRIIGRCPQPIFDPAAVTPVIWRTGDRVRFEEISLSVFDTWTHKPQQ